MSTASRFERFVQHIAVTSAQEEAALRTARTVTEALSRHYYGQPIADATTMKVIGAYGKGTAARPPRDIDMLFVMPDSEYNRFRTYRSNGQSALLQEVKEVLQKRFTTTERIRGDGQVVVAEFSGHRAEILPAWQLLLPGFRIPDTHNGGRWRKVNHDAEIRHINRSDAYNKGGTRHLVKIAKTWQQECSVPVSSLVLELCAVRFLFWSWFPRAETFHDYPAMVRDFFRFLIRQSGGSSSIPGTTERKMHGTEWKSKAESAYRMATQACEYERLGKESDAVAEWQKIFGRCYVG
ncbi:SMODS domain-containing nucleotidyltransferase [Streptomyces sp. cg40]|uniref:SMODS domain-containing nucleotidyltransferase n=1 Tax=Streptomyces sp. cg40 TaxID=3419764 RepID=UPI003D075CE4